MHAKSLQSCPTLCDPMDCSLPGSSVYGILQARILEWIAMPFVRASSRPRDWTCISYIFCIGRQGFFITRATLDALNFHKSPQKNNEYWYIAMLLINDCEISTATPPKVDNMSSYLWSQVLFIIFCYTVILTVHSLTRLKASREARAVSVCWTLHSKHSVLIHGRGSIYLCCSIVDLV